MILLIAATICAGIATGQTRAVPGLTNEHIGEFLKVSGTTDKFFTPTRPHTPYAFRLTTKAGGHVRICVWPEIYEKIGNHSLLETTGTSVEVNGEIAPYRGRLELHAQDWMDVGVVSDSTGSSDTLASQLSQRQSKR